MQPTAQHTMADGSQHTSTDAAVSVGPDAVVVKDVDIVLEDQAAAPARRTCTWLDAAYHSVTAMVGAGVLGLPSTLSTLGWAGGLIMITATFWMSWYTYKLLVHMHEVPDLDAKGEVPYKRMDRYQDLTTYIFRSKRLGTWTLLPFQMAVLVGMALTYTVVGAEDLKQLVGILSPDTHLSLWTYLVAFGAVEVLLSMLPSFNELSLVSLMGAIMSVGYCTIATVMAAMHRPGPDVSYVPRPEATSTNYVFDVLNAVTTMLFAYSGHNISLEVQATLPSPPSTVRPMMRGVNLAFTLTAACYLCVTVTGFHAFGIGVTGNVLQSFTTGPKWPIAMANLMVVLHVAAAYQVYTQPVFDALEGAIWKKGVPLWGRVVARTLYVAVLTLVAVMIPFFTSLMGLVGALGITPTTFLLPCLLWLMYKKPRRWGWEWCINWGLVFVTGVIGVFGTIGAMYTIVVQSKSYSFLAA